MEFFGFSTTTWKLNCKVPRSFGAAKGLQRPSGLQIWSQALSIEDNLSCHWENPAGISGIRITFSWVGFLHDKGVDITRLQSPHHSWSMPDTPTVTISGWDTWMAVLDVQAPQGFAGWNHDSEVTNGPRWMHTI